MQMIVWRFRQMDAIFKSSRWDGGAGAVGANRSAGSVLPAFEADVETAAGQSSYAQIAVGTSEQHPSTELH